MPQQERNEHMISELGNWNVADQYTKNKIMRPLNLCDYYEDIALFGYESIADELIGFSSPPNDVIRIRAMNRLIKELIRLIDNSKFALKKPGTLKDILKYKESLKTIESILPNLIKTSVNQINKTRTQSIKNYSLFDEILEKISQIKSKINEPLNKNNLIFVDKEEFDPSVFKDAIKKRMVNKG